LKGEVGKFDFEERKNLPSPKELDRVLNAKNHDNFNLAIVD
jgi:hypothetical protein